MIGENIKRARLSQGLSLQELSERMTDAGFPTTKATLSNYENGKYIPTAEALDCISRETFTPSDYLRREKTYAFSLQFFHKPELIDRKTQFLEAYVETGLERFLYVDELLGISANWKKRPRQKLTVANRAEIERLSESFREEYGAGSDSIASVCALLEKKGWHIFSNPDFCQTDSNISGYDSNSGVPFILYKYEGYLDEMRLSLLKSVGYSLIEGPTQQETDLLVEHFARAVLLPADLCRFTFGEKRTTMTKQELTTGKKLFGLGRVSIIKRLYELDIIDDRIYSEYMAFVLDRYNMTRFNGLADESMFFEVPTSYEMRVARLNAEGIASISSFDEYFRPSK